MAFAKIFDVDWERATRVTDGDSFSVRITEEEGEAPAGFVKVPWNALYDSKPPVAAAGASIPAVAPASGESAVGAPQASLDLPFFGVDPDTGKRRVESSIAVASALKQSAPIESDKARLGRAMLTRAFGGPALEDDEDLAETGWGVIWGASVTPEIRAALKPLLDHRRGACGADGLFREFDYRTGESVRAFLQRNGTDHGGVTFESVPFYLLLVGRPDDIPFSFQTLLDVEYRVGRLDLSSPEAYEKYARSLVATELGTASARERVVHAFGAEHEGDAPTRLSAEVLVRAAPLWLEKDRHRKLRDKFGLAARMDVGDAANKARLLEIVRGAGGRPELLFTAGHGLACAAGSPRQPGEQGALVTADWDGFSRIDAGSRFAAEDLSADADVAGMVVFLFACYGIGTPATDSFPTRAGQILAPRPFCSALPQALLSHQRGASLGVFGHVDRTLTWSLQPPQAPVATAPFERAVLYVLRGAPLGRALDDLNQRSATLVATVAEALRPAGSPLDDVKIVSDWTQQRDATAFVLLGDPAARLKR